MSAYQLPGMTLKGPPPFLNNQTESGWKLLDAGVWVTGDPQLQLHGFMQPGEEWVEAEVMLQRAKTLPGGPTGQHFAERLFLQQRDIPVEWDRYDLIFPDTVWKSPDGSQYVPCLSMIKDRWQFEFLPVEEVDWTDRYRVVRTLA